MLWVLLRKQIAERLSVFRRDKSRLDISGNILSLLLTGAVIAVVVVVFARFIDMYCAIRINNALDVPARQFELLTFIYSALFVFGVFSGIKAINFAIFESEDQKLLITLPIAPSTIFYSKLIILYAKQVIVFLMTILPINLTFAVVAAQSAYYIVMTVAMCLLFPLITLAFSSIFCFPVFYLKRFVQSKYALLLVLVTAATGLVFWGYSSILDFMKTMLTTGELRFFFKESVMRTIIEGTKYLYPSNVMAGLLLKRDIATNILLVTLTTAVASAAGFLVVNLLFNKANHARTSANKKFLYTSVPDIRKKHIMIALVAKEFKLVFRTPSYAFQYFSVAAVMPLMVYFCMGIGSDLLETLVFSKNNFELAIFVVLLFGTLTNTFCATNISREGPAFYAMKTMPIPYEQIIGAKIIFCSIVAFASTLASGLVVLLSGYINFGDFAFLFFVAMALAEAQICFATRKDLNRPTFSTDEDCEITESNSTISTIIIVGLTLTAALGGLALFFSLYNGSLNGQNSALLTIAFVGLSAIAICGGAVAYLLTGLKKRFYEMTEGD
ncbi:MAG: hypothetical protein EOM87_01630 [Clostridia bacterium]|nr:hypothetical protein [Clostridia bacterium]